MTEAQRAHIRILEQAQLTVRTHERRVHVHTQGSQKTLPITINGRTYASIREAKETLRVGQLKIERWLADGIARRG